MTSRYIDLIHQTFDFPVFDFQLDGDYLKFHGIDLRKIVEQYGTPLRITYVPKIGQQIEKARDIFNNAMQKHGYKGSYTYCYCTKSSHFSFVMEAALHNGSHLETSSAFDMQLIRKLYDKRIIENDRFIICNGFKPKEYTEEIIEFIEADRGNVIPVLDNLDELDHYRHINSKPVELGIRMAAEEEPNFEFYTSRLGIRVNDILPFYKDKIQNNPQFALKMLHFFINTGISDSAYYWSELDKFAGLYCEMKKICPELQYLDIGGGFPVPNSLYMDYDYQYMADEIIANIKARCESEGVEPPGIFTEFGSFTVAESSATLFSVLNEKQQNDAEKWYMIDGSFITHLPDTWGTNQRYILLPVNKWKNPYHRINLGGLTCDSLDYYNSEVHQNQVFLPQIGDQEEPLIVGFFNTGAYQEALGGTGGIQHCLIPSVKHLLIDHDADGEQRCTVFREEQKGEEMLRHLGY